MSCHCIDLDKLSWMHLYTGMKVHIYSNKINSYGFWLTGVIVTPSRRESKTQLTCQDCFGCELKKLLQKKFLGLHFDGSTGRTSYIPNRMYACMYHMYVPYVCMYSLHVLAVILPQDNSGQLAIIKDKTT